MRTNFVVDRIITKYYYYYSYNTILPEPHHLSVLSNFILQYLVKLVLSLERRYYPIMPPPKVMFFVRRITKNYGKVLCVLSILIWMMMIFDTRMQYPPPSVKSKISLKKSKNVRAKIVKRTTHEDPNSRRAELPDWPLKQSVSVDDYLDLSNSNSFLRKPKSSRMFPDLTSRFCGSHVKIIILVASEPRNYKERNAIRETWGSASYILPKGVRIAFILGDSESESVENRITMEQNSHNDIVQENFVDTYYNLTLKSLALLKWVNLTCSLAATSNGGPKFIFKTDDDMFINVDRLLTVAKNMPSVKLIGALVCGSIPIADPTNKFYMPKYLYPESLYPGYLSGAGYMIHGSIIPILLETAKKTPLIHFEDIFVTGVLAKRSNIRPQDSQFFSSHDFEDPADFCNFTTMISYHQLQPKALRYVWSNRIIPVPSTSTYKSQCVRKIPRMDSKRRRLCYSLLKD